MEEEREWNQDSLGAIDHIMKSLMTDGPWTAVPCCPLPPTWLCVRTLVRPWGRGAMVGRWFRRDLRRDHGGLHRLPTLCTRRSIQAGAA